MQYYRINKYSATNFAYKLLCSLDPLCKLSLSPLRRRFSVNHTIFVDSKFNLVEKFVEALIARGYKKDSNVLSFSFVGKEVHYLIDNNSITVWVYGKRS